MNKINISKPKLLISLSFVFFILGCNKDNGATYSIDEEFIKNFIDDRFFAKDNSVFKPVLNTKNRSDAPIVKALKSYFTANPKEAKKLEAKYGYPIWTNIKHVEDQEGEGLMISFAKKNNKRIERVLYVHQNKGSKVLKFGGFERNDIKKLKRMSNPVKKNLETFNELNYEQAATQVLFFEYASFQEVDCDLINDLQNLSGFTDGDLDTRSCTEVWLDTYYVYPSGYRYLISSELLGVYCTATGPDYTGTTGSGDNPYANNNLACKTSCTWNETIVNRVFATKSAWGFVTERGNATLSARIDCQTINPVGYTKNTVPNIRVNSGNANISSTFYEISKTPASLSNPNASITFSINGDINFTSTAGSNVGFGISSGTIEWGSSGQSSFTRSYYFQSTKNFN